MAELKTYQAALMAAQIAAPITPIKIAPVNALPLGEP